MEKRNFFMLRSLNLAEFKEDSFGLESADGTSAVSRSSSAASSSSSDADWKVISEAPGSLGQEIDYTEYVLDSPAPGGVRPIKQEDDPERCIMVLDLPEPSETRRVSMVVEDTATAFTDTVSLEQVLANYHTLKSTHAADILHSGANFFTINNNGPGTLYTTYLDTGEADIVGKLTHSESTTFDKFRFSFLKRVAGAEE